MKSYTDKFFCFSPPVMLATFFFEVGLALYVVWRYKLNDISRLVLSILAALATFQLAEYVVCEGLFGLSGVDWSRIGFMTITLLPPLGLHLATVLAKKRAQSLLLAAYGSAVAFLVFFALAPGAVAHEVCQGNYAIFSIASMSLPLYITYYYGWLVATVLLCRQWAQHEKNKHHQTALRGLAVGYLLFLLPTTAMNLIDSSTLAGVPSIMCGFAVLLAATLAVWVLPAAVAKKN